MKIRALVLCLLAGGGPLFACDFCNCLMGINPYYTSGNVLHVSMLFQHSTSSGEAAAGPALMRYDPVGTLSPAAITHGGPGPSTETRRTVELAYRYHLFDDFMLSGLVPYRMTQIRSAESFSINGFGDITVLAHYVLKPVLWEQTPVTLLVGGGVQLPTGSTSRSDPGGELVEPDVQPGSGSVNYVLSSTLTVQPGQWTFALDAYGKLNSRNSGQNKLGNSLSLSAGISRELTRDNYSLFAVVASGGLRGETASKNIVEGLEDGETGSTSLYGNLGVQVFLGVLRLDVGVLLPVLQNRPAGSPDEDTRVISGLRLEL